MSCPGKLGREYGKPNWNNDKSRTRQHDQCNSNQQDTAADDEHDNSPDRLDGPKPRLVKESFCPVHTKRSTTLSPQAPRMKRSPYALENWNLCRLQFVA